MQIRIFLAFIFFFSFSISFAQESFQERVLNYIEQYKDIAIEEQIRTGVPAAIKLAQGVFETGAGSSELCNNAFNHFGIKCKSNWTGPSYAYTDDAKDECFRKYEKVLESYKDHSDFLKSNSRYAGLFKLDIEDYKGWAHGLKKAGYATNPQYAYRLIKFIEEYDLQEYTKVALHYDKMKLESTHKAIAQDHSIEKGHQTEQSIEIEETTFEHFAYEKKQKQEQINTSEFYKKTTKNGLKGFYARKGDLLLESAIKNKIRYNRLLQINDLPDAELEEDLFIYLEPKHKIGANETHTVQEGSSLLKISQEEGIQLKQLRVLNKLEESEEPRVGAILYLREMNSKKPDLKEINKLNNERENRIISKPAKYEYVSTQEEDKDDFEEEVNEKGNSPAAENEFVNIGNELAIEEEMEQNIKMQMEESEEKSEDQDDLSPLEKLKQHMDKTVYAGRNNVNSNVEEEEGDIASEITYTTIPARKANAVSPAPISQKASGNVKYHTVKRGDTAFSISKTYGISINQLKQWNNLSSSMTVQIGQKLKVAP